VKVVRTIEWLLLSLGVLLVASYLVMRLHGIVSSRAAVSSFHVLQKVSGTRADRITGELYLPPPQNVDFGLWSEKRIFEYQLSLARYSAAPLALLRIGKLHVEVPVFDGTDDLTLNRGVGRIIGTAKPGERGNIGIAGHRDGFFRGLKDIRSGDEVDLVMPMKTWRYVVDHVQIVSPEDVSVLANRGVPVLTLVTCYPFYFIGDAPQRCIFRCFLKEQVDEAVALQTAR
jgi:sortase A